MIDRESTILELEWVLNDIEENGHYQIEYYADMIRKAVKLLKEQEPVVRCMDCKHYTKEDVWGEFSGVPVLGTSDAPICHKWGPGDCLTKPDGFCFLAERRDVDT